MVAALLMAAAAAVSDQPNNSLIDLFFVLFFLFFFSNFRCANEYGKLGKGGEKKRKEKKKGWTKITEPAALRRPLPDHIDNL